MKVEQLKLLMRQYKVREVDLQEKFIQSPGPGGQNVNKVATCVMLVHEPSGIQVKCHKFRNQQSNRLWARVMLLDVISSRDKKEQLLEQKRDHVRSVAKRKRSKASQEKILADKKSKSVNKEIRKKILPRNVDRYA